VSPSTHYAKLHRQANAQAATKATPYHKAHADFSNATQTACNMTQTTVAQNALQSFTLIRAFAGR